MASEAIGQASSFEAWMAGTYDISGADAGPMINTAPLQSYLPRGTRS